MRCAKALRASWEWRVPSGELKFVIRNSQFIISFRASPTKSQRIVPSRWTVWMGRPLSIADCPSNWGCFQTPSKAVELWVEKQCFCSSKALQLMVKSTAFAEAIQALFVMHLNQTENQFDSNWSCVWIKCIIVFESNWSRIWIKLKGPSGLYWRKVAVGLFSNPSALPIYLLRFVIMGPSFWYRRSY